MTLAAIVTAAGRGLRAGGEVPKQWRPLAGRPVLDRSLAPFLARPDIAHVVVTLAKGDPAAATLPARDPRLRVVAGAAERAGSVRAGLAALEGTGTTRVLIHDAARPLVTGALIDRVVAALGTHDGALPALPVADALWRAEGAAAQAPVPRAGLWRAQTPQGFRYDAILAAHAAHATSGGGAAADDAEVARAAGLDVVIVEGDEDNLKLTWPGDFARAEAIVRNREATGARMDDIRTGNGFDVHRFGPGDHVMLCGVAVPFGRGLQGHSDADVGLHALCDAIYGALAEGDIGSHFPPSESRWKGAASHIFVAHAAARIAARGFRLANADVTLVCEAPKIAPHADAMRAELARLLGAEAARVSVKATTTERLGFAGRGEGIAALASVTLVAP